MARFTTTIATTSGTSNTRNLTSIIPLLLKTEIPKIPLANCSRGAWFESYPKDLSFHLTFHSLRFQLTSCHRAFKNIDSLNNLTSPTLSALGWKRELINCSINTKERLGVEKISFKGEGDFLIEVKGNILFPHFFYFLIKIVKVFF